MRRVEETMSDERSTSRLAGPLPADSELAEARKRLLEQDLAFRTALSRALRARAKTLQGCLGLPPSMRT
jgi:hypothetical protein